MTPFLDPDEPPPVEIVNPDGRGPVVLTCDHASHRLPRRVGALGITPAALASHIGWDPGAAEVARRMSALLDAPLVLSGYSRLVVDCNRPPGTPSAIPEVSAGITIPGNRRLPAAESATRTAALPVPYHAAIADLLDRRAAQGQPTALLAIHSFTADYPGEARPWQVGIAYNRDRRLASLLIERLRRDPGLVVGDNQPYAVDDDSDYTIPVHGEGRGLPHALVEIRQDLLAEPGGAERWAGLLARAFADVAGVMTRRPAPVGESVPS